MFIIIMMIIIILYNERGTNIVFGPCWLSFMDGFFKTSVNIGELFI